jgi:hypothetical protein
MDSDMARDGPEIEASEQASMIEFSVDRKGQ